MKYIFGPVPSRRLGMSLGIDIIPFKVCSFDCIYCQLGRTTRKTIHRDRFSDPARLVACLRETLPDVTADYITFSGSGEPTFNSDLGFFIKEAKKLSPIPVAVLTNGSLLGEAEVQEALSEAALVVPSLDAATQDMFEKVNRPCRELKIDAILDGLRTFSEGFRGKLWVEVMLVRGINDVEAEIRKISSALSNIKAEKIQLNTVERPPAESFARPLSKDEKEKIKGYFDERAEVIMSFVNRHVSNSRHRLNPAEPSTEDVLTPMAERQEEIVNLLKRRPCTTKDVADALGLNINEVSKYLGILSEKGLIEPVSTMTGLTYFRGRPGT